MKFDDEVQQQIERFRDRKARQVKSDPEGDLLPVVDFYRGGKPVASAMGDKVDRDVTLDIATAGVSGFAADEIWVSLETFVAHRMTNPLTHKRWEQGEMQEAWRAGERDAVTESLLLVRADRAGVIEQWMLPYQRRRGEVRWVNHHELKHIRDDGKDSRERVSGIVPDTLRHAFTLDTKVDEAMAMADQMGVPRDEARIHMDCATAKIMLLKTGAAVLLMTDPDDKKRLEIIDHSFMDTTAKAMKDSILLSAARSDQVDDDAFSKLAEMLDARPDEWNVYRPEDLREMQAER